MREERRDTSIGEESPDEGGPRETANALLVIICVFRRVVVDVAVPKGGGSCHQVRSV